MSEKIHCDLCDRVIPDKEKRMTLRVGVSKGNVGSVENEPHDVCLACVRRNDTLATWLKAYSSLPDDDGL